LRRGQSLDYCFKGGKGWGKGLKGYGGVEYLGEWSFTAIYGGRIPQHYYPVERAMFVNRNTGRPLQEDFNRD